MDARPADVETYLTVLPPEARATLLELRRITFDVAPAAVESISYGVPAYKYRGRPLVYFGAWKNHCAVYGLNLAEHEQELAGYATAKGTIRFPLGQPLPDALIRALLLERLAQIEAAPARTQQARPRQRSSGA